MTANHDCNFVIEPTIPKCVIITDSDTPLGGAFAAQFAREGYCLVLLSAAPENSSLVSSLRELGAEKVLHCQADLSQPQNIEALFSELDNSGVRIETLVNNLTVTGTEISDGPEDDAVELLKKMETHAKFSRTFVSKLQPDTIGKILNICSIIPCASDSFLSVYHPVMSALVSFSEEMAQDFCDARVRVSCFCPDPAACRLFDERSNAHSEISKTHLRAREEVASSGYREFKKGERICCVGRPNRVVTFVRRLPSKAYSARRGPVGAVMALRTSVLDGRPERTRGRVEA